LNNAEIYVKPKISSADLYLYQLRNAND